MKRFSVLLPLFFAFLMLSVTSCDNESFTPKPKGYFRIDFPEKTYQQYEGECPYRFEYPDYAVIRPYTRGNEFCWFNLDFPKQQARLHFSYFPLQNDLSKHMEDSRTLAYKHTVKALDIEESVFSKPEDRVYAMIYRIYGNTASSVQFFITDSTDHFLRGALYFSSLPNADSLAPAIDFIEKDIDHLFQSFKWEETTPKP